MKTLSKGLMKESRRRLYCAIIPYKDRYEFQSQFFKLIEGDYQEITLCNFPEEGITEIELRLHPEEATLLVLITGCEIICFEDS